MIIGYIYEEKKYKSFSTSRTLALATTAATRLTLQG